MQDQRMGQDKKSSKEFAGGEKRVSEAVTSCAEFLWRSLRVVKVSGGKEAGS